MSRPDARPRRLPGGRYEWRLVDERRNQRLVDWWSLAHVAAGLVLALVVPPWWALAAMVLYEPFEVLVLSPILARFGVSFGYESLENSLVDLGFDVAGVALAAWVVRPLVGL